MGAESAGGTPERGRAEGAKPPEAIPRAFGEVWGELPPRRRRSLTLLFTALVPGMIFWGLIIGAIFNDFVLSMGEDEAAGGLWDKRLVFLLSILPMCIMLRPAVVWWLERWPERRRGIYLAAHLVSRLVWIPVAFAPFLASAARHDLRFALLTGALVVFGLAQTICATAWLGWVAEIVPNEIRARYLGRRRAVGLAAKVVVAILCSMYLDGHGRSWEAFRNVFLLAVGAGVVQWLFMAFVEHVPAARSPSDGHFWRTTREVAGDPSFRRVVRVFALWFAASGFTNAFVGILLLKRLHLPLTHVSVFVTLSVATQMAFLGLWGAFRDRYGLRTALLAAMGVELLWPLPLFLARADLVTPVALAYVLFGLGWSGVFLSQQHMLLHYSKGRRGAVPLAVAAFVLALVQFVAPNLANQILNVPVGGAPLLRQSWIVLGHRLHDVHVIIGVGVVLRLAAFGAAMGLKVPARRPPSDEVLRLFVTRNPMRAFLNFFLFVGGRVSERMGSGRFLDRHPGGRWQDDFEPGEPPPSAPGDHLDDSPPGR